MEVTKNKLPFNTGDERKKKPFDTGDWLIEVTTRAGLIFYIYIW